MIQDDFENNFRGVRHWIAITTLNNECDGKCQYEGKCAQEPASTSLSWRHLFMNGALPPASVEALQQGVNPAHGVCEV
ncbi:MAG: hypothetical protein ACTJLL_02140 [Anaplasma sp.]